MARVLIVDDDPFIRKVIRRELQNGGYEVTEAESGFQALKLALTVPFPDLITLDINMPKMNGYETFSRIRQELKKSQAIPLEKREIPVIFVTATDTIEDRRIGFEIGAVDFITKPIKKGNLLAVVNKILKPEARLKGLTALVVDDSKIYRRLLVEILRREGLSILEAQDGSEAYDIIRSQTAGINIVITDLSMPNMEGDILCHKIRNELNLKHLPVIILTGIDDQTKLLELFKSGATDYLAKPFVKEELLARLNVHLELEQALSDLKEAQKTSETANQARNEFLNNIGHEIRTPLNAINGFIALMLCTRLTAQQKDYLNKVKSSSQTLLGVINDLLDLSKMESGMIRITSIDFDLEDIFEEVSSSIGPLAEEKRLELIFQIDEDVPLLLTGDPIRLRQIFLNLGNNAVKFTETGEIVISAKLAQSTVSLPNQVKLNFSVEDTGIGVSPEKANILFQSFRQADGSITRKYGGSGLGLTICKRLTNLMGGEITVENNEGQGSRFSFSVLLTKQKHQKETLAFFPKGISTKRILIIDDNSISRRVLYKMLAPIGVDIKLADTGKKGLDLFQKALAHKMPYDLVLLDQTLSDANGPVILKNMSETTPSHNFRSILMISKYDERCNDKPEKHPVPDLYVTKPLIRTVLLNTVKSAFVETSSNVNSDKSGENDINQTLSGIQGARILLVEDNAINQMILTELLEIEHFNVTIANNGQEAVDTVFKNLRKNSSPPFKSAFDIILMDLEMPVMNGYDATQKIRASNRFSNLPIIALSAHAKDHENSKWQDCGMNDYLPKPVDPDQLYRLLVRWVRPRSSRIKDDRRKSRPSLNNNRLPVSIEGIDLESGLKSVSGNQVLFFKLLKEFHEDFRESAEKIIKAIAGGDFTYAKLTTHTIKGVSGNIGAKKLYEASKKLDAALTTKNAEQIMGVAADFEKALKVVICATAFTQPLISSNRIDAADLPKDSVDLSHTEPMFSELANLLHDGDSEAEDFVERMLIHFKDSLFQDQMRLLHSQISKYNFKDALKTLTQLANDIGFSIKPDMTEQI